MVYDRKFSCVLFLSHTGYKDSSNSSSTSFFCDCRYLVFGSLFFVIRSRFTIYNFFLLLLGCDITDIFISFQYFTVETVPTWFFWPFLHLTVFFSFLCRLQTYIHPFHMCFFLVNPPFDSSEGHLWSDTPLTRRISCPSPTFCRPCYFACVSYFLVVQVRYIMVVGTIEGGTFFVLISPKWRLLDLVVHDPVSFLSPHVR